MDDSLKKLIILTQPMSHVHGKIFGKNVFKKMLLQMRTLFLDQMGTVKAGEE